MLPTKPAQEPWIAPAGRWLTRRRSVLFAPLFTVVLLTACPASARWLDWSRDLAGLACLVVGIWLRLLAASYHESSEEDHPITAGPYAWIRHPLYLANFLLGLGIVLLAGWWPMVLIYALFSIVLYISVIRAEETHLSFRYGKEYTDYLCSVPAVIPWRRYRGTAYGLRNDYKMKKGREWLKVAGYGVGAAGVLLFKGVRNHFQIPAGLVSFPAPSWLLAAIATGVVIVRPTTRSSLLRTLQTVLIILCAILIALRIHNPS